MFRRAFRSFQRIAFGYLGYSSIVWCMPDFDEKIDLPSKALAKQDPSNPSVYVIIGGGPASYVCAHTLRSEGFQGKIIVVADEQPVNSLLFGSNIKLEHLDDKFFRYGVDLKLSGVTSVDSKNSVVNLSDGTQIKYHKLCVAKEPVLQVPGIYENAHKNLENVVTLDSINDHSKLHELSNSKNVVFAGLNLKTLGVLGWLKANITVIEPNDEPLINVLGRDIANEVFNALRRQGIRIITGTPDELISDTSHLNSVKMVHNHEFRGKQTEIIPADLLVITEATAINNHCLPPELLSTDGTVHVDMFMKSANSNVYAAGRGINALDTWTEQRISPLGVSSAKTGAYAAYNMLGKSTNYSELPFRSFNIGVQVDIIGNTESHDWYWTEKINHNQLVTYFYRNKRCIGAVVYNHPEVSQKLNDAIKGGLVPSPHYWGRELSVDSILKSF